MIRNLQVLAEPSQRISDESKNKNNEIAWPDISGFRNILVHDYLGIDRDTIWSVVEKDILVLRSFLEEMLSDHGLIKSE